MDLTEKSVGIFKFIISALIDGSAFRVSRDSVTNFKDEIVFENQGVFHPKEEDEIFIKNDDQNMRDWNSNLKLPRGDLLIRLKFKLPRKLSDKQMQVLKAIYK